MSSSTARSAPRKLRHYDDLAILNFIDRHKTQNAGRSPSERQIAAGMQLSGKSVAHDIVHRLVRRGLLISTVHHRGWVAELTITRSGNYALKAWRAQRESVPVTGAAVPPIELETAVRGAR